MYSLDNETYELLEQLFDTMFRIFLRRIKTHGRPENE